MVETGVMYLQEPMFVDKYLKNPLALFSVRMKSNYRPRSKIVTNVFIVIAYVN